MTAKPEEHPNRREALQLGAALGATLAGGGALGVAVDAAAGAARDKVSLKMTLPQAKTFARKIQNDDKFRARFEKDPHTVLARSGIGVPRHFFPDHVTLPSKKRLKEALDAKLKRVRRGGVTDAELFIIIIAWIFDDIIIIIIIS